MRNSQRKSNKRNTQHRSHQKAEEIKDENKDKDGDKNEEEDKDRQGPVQLSDIVVAKPTTRNRDVQIELIGAKIVGRPWILIDREMQHELKCVKKKETLWKMNSLTMEDRVIDENVIGFTHGVRQFVGETDVGTKG